MGKEQHTNKLDLNCDAWSRDPSLPTKRGRVARLYTGDERALGAAVVLLSVGPPPGGHTSPESQEPKPPALGSSIPEAAMLLDVEPCNQEDRPGAGARPRVGPSAEDVSRAEQSPLGYGMRGCWRVPITTSGPLARSHLALHIDLHLCSGDVPRPGRGLVDRPRMLRFRFTWKMWGSRGAGSWQFWGTMPPFMHVLRSPVWSVETGGATRGNSGSVASAAPYPLEPLTSRLGARRVGGGSPRRTLAMPINGQRVRHTRAQWLARQILCGDGAHSSRMSWHVDYALSRVNMYKLTRSGSSR